MRSCYTTYHMIRRIVVIALGLGWLLLLMQFAPADYLLQAKYDNAGPHFGRIFLLAMYPISVLTMLSGVFGRNLLERKREDKTTAEKGGLVAPDDTTLQTVNDRSKLVFRYHCETCGYQVVKRGEDRACPKCGTQMKGRWEP